MIVCQCKAVSDSTVRSLVKNGATTVRQVAACCGAGTDCGSCIRTVEAIVRAERSESRGGFVSLASLGVPSPSPILG